MYWIVVIICIFLNVNNVFGQCTPISRYNFPNWESNVWLGGFVPSSHIPSNVPMSGFNYASVAHISNMDTSSTYCPGYVWGQPASCSEGLSPPSVGVGLRVARMYNASQCYVRFFCYKQKNADALQQDADCDGLVDAYDSDHGGTIPDSDNDGWNNLVDPWPNNSSLPGNGLWTRRTWKHKTLNATWEVYQQGSEQVYRCLGDGCSGVISPPVSPGDWWVIIPDVDKTWTQFFDTTQTATVGTSETRVSGDLAHFSDGIKGISEKGDGIISRLEDIYNRQNSQTNSIVGELESLKGAVDQVKGAIDNLDIGVNIPPSDYSPVTSRQDIQTGVMNQIKEKIPEVGTLNDIQDLPTEGLNDHSLYNEEAGLNKYEEHKSGFKAALFSIWANSPIKSLIQGSGIGASGSPVVSVNLGWLGNFEFDVSIFDNIYDVFGVFLVGFSAILGFMVVFRG